MEDLNNTIKQLDLIDIYGTLIQLDQINHFFFKYSESFTRSEHRLIHKTSLNKLKRIQIIPSILLSQWN